MNLLWPVPGYHVVVSGYADWRDYGLHGGIDIEAPVVPTVAVADGAITFVGWAGNAGRTVWLDFPGHRVQYSHLWSFNVTVDQAVRAGDVIGHVGGSGYRVDDYFGNHLHFCLFASERPATGPSYWSDFVGMWVLDPELYLGQEDDMPLSDDDIQRLADRLARILEAQLNSQFKALTNAQEARSMAERNNLIQQTTRLITALE